MSFLKRLLGLGSGVGSGGADGPAPVAKQAEYKGFMVAASPYKVDGQYQVCGVISKDVDGARKEHRFVRADRFAGLDDAVEVSLGKGRHLVDEQGERIFD